MRGLGFEIPWLEDGGGDGVAALSFVICYDRALFFQIYAGVRICVLSTDLLVGLVAISFGVSMCELACTVGSHSPI
eukprot:IDg2122t1